MDIDLTTTLITSISSVIVGYLALLAGRNDAGTISKKEIRNSQVYNVLGPMDLLLSFPDERSPEKLFKSLREIVDNHYNLVPAPILKEIKLLGQSKELTFSSFTELSVIVSSYFNWTNRAIGYPYDSSKINRKFTPNTERNTKIHMITTVAFGLAYIMALCFFLVCLLVTLSDKSINVPSWLIQTVFIILAVGTIWSSSASRSQGK